MFSGEIVFSYSTYINGVLTPNNGTIFLMKLDYKCLPPFFASCLAFPVRQPLRTYKLICTAQNQMYFKKL